MCDIATRVGVERFLHISTDEVYGSIEEGSFSESDPLSPRSPYSAAKAGVLGLARAMAREFGAEGIRVNCITPGLIETDITQGKLTPDKKQEIAETIPLARLGRADDVAGACVFLASDLSAYCTGITLDVNGGMLIH